MKLVTYDGGKVGRIDGDEIVRLDVSDMRTYFERGGAGDQGERTPLAEADLDAPIVPKKFLHTAGNFREHEEESKRVGWSHAIAPWIVFFQNVDAIVGPDDPVVYPEHLTEELDYELELAVVIGKPGRHIPRDRALEHVFGYTVANDVTARDRQAVPHPEGGWEYRLGPGKNFDTAAPLGPWIVTADEIPDPQDLGLRTYVNGEIRQSNTTAKMIWDVATIVSYFSDFYTLQPGVVIETGTPGGTAWATDPEIGGKPYARDDVMRAGYLQPGDVVTVEIDGIGTLTNPIVGAPLEDAEVRKEGVAAKIGVSDI